MRRNPRERTHMSFSFKLNIEPEVAKQMVTILTAVATQIAIINFY